MKVHDTVLYIILTKSYRGWEKTATPFVYDDPETARRYCKYMEEYSDQEYGVFEFVLNDETNWRECE